MKVYIAGPYSKGDVAVNVRNAIMAGNMVAQRGHIPFIPHLTHFWHMLTPREYQFWLDQDIEWLKDCDAILRLDGESSGADNEMRLAEKWGLLIYHSVFEIPTAEEFKKAGLATVQSMRKA